MKASQVNQVIASRAPSIWLPVIVVYMYCYLVSLDLTSDLLRDSERYEWNPPLPLSGYMYPRTKTRAAFRNI